MSAFVLVPLMIALGSLSLSDPADGKSPRGGATESSPERRALAYLAQEVPHWSRENKCFSCHNNGDAARALYTAVRLSEPVPAKALADTTAWLSRPQGWDKNGGEGPFNDRGLARIQFAAALVEALEAKQLPDRTALRQ